MFVHEPTPLYVEIMIDVIKRYPEGIKRNDLKHFLQPSGVKVSKDQATQTISAARKLDLISEDKELIKPLFDVQNDCQAKDILLESFDEKVLSSLDVEPWFSPYYSFLLGRDHDGSKKRTYDDWVREFDSINYAGARADESPVNTTKLSGFARWVVYVGLGWLDPFGVFQPNPYDRIRRALKKEKSIGKEFDGDAFIEKIAALCPELDCGEYFVKYNPDRIKDDRKLSLGYSHALLDLHEDEVIRLHCYEDSRGYDMSIASPILDNKTMKSTRIDKVVILRS